jgi:hypothetical protein
MRLFFALALSLCLFPVAGCGDDSDNGDMSLAPDMSASGKNCLGIVTCIMGCTSGDQVKCAMDCAATGSTKGMAGYNALITCAYGICTKPGDGGTAACSSSTDTSSGCTDCLLNAAQSNACSTQLNACLSGT